MEIMDRVRRIVTAIACFALAVVFAGCPTDTGAQGYPGSLTITGLRGSAGIAVHVFAAGTNLSTFFAVQNEMGSRNNIVGLSGGAIIGDNRFLIDAWDNTIGHRTGPFAKSATLPVVLFDESGGNNVANPRFRLATVAFRNGGATVSFGNFIPVVGGAPPQVYSSRLVVSGLEVDAANLPLVFVFTPSTDLSTQQAIYSVLENGWIARGDFDLDRDFFSMGRGWEDSVWMSGDWTGSGVFHVLLFDIEGGLFDIANPRLSVAAGVAFVNGSATVDIGNFVPVVGGSPPPLPPPPYHSRLVINGLDVDPTTPPIVFVFPPGTDLSTQQAIHSVFENGWIARGNFVQDGGFFSMGRGWEDSVWMYGDWTEWGVFQVLLLNTEGGYFDTANPMFSVASGVAFVNGSATVDIGNFVPVVGGSPPSLPPPPYHSRLVINNLVGDTDTHNVFVFPLGTDLSTHQAIGNVFMNGWLAKGSLVLGYKNAFSMVDQMSGDWIGSGPFQVLLFNVYGGLHDLDNPRYKRLPTVSFTDGSATVVWGNFIPVDK